MVDPQLLIVYIAVALIYFAATGVVKGIKKIGHGAKTVACKMHVAHCDAPVVKK